MTPERILQNAVRLANRPETAKGYRKYIMWTRLYTKTLTVVPGPNLRKAMNRVWRMKADRIRVWSIKEIQTRVRATGMDITQTNS